MQSLLKTSKADVFIGDKLVVRLRDHGLSKNDNIIVTVCQTVGGLLSGYDVWLRNVWVIVIVVDGKFGADAVAVVGVVASAVVGADEDCAVEGVTEARCGSSPSRPPALRVMVDEFAVVATVVVVGVVMVVITLMKNVFMVKLVTCWKQAAMM